MGKSIKLLNDNPLKVKKGHLLKYFSSCGPKFDISVDIMNLGADKEARQVFRFMTFHIQSSHFTPGVNIPKVQVKDGNVLIVNGIMSSRDYKFEYMIPFSNTGKWFNLRLSQVERQVIFYYNTL